MFEIAVKDIFTKIQRGNSNLTKSYCTQNVGVYPVYSANNDIPLGYCDSYNYDGRFLTISINGLAGVIKIINGKFSTTADRVVCIPRKNISIDYVKYILEEKLRKTAKGRKGDLGKNEFTKLTPGMIKKVTIPIPMLSNGDFDFETQKEIASKYEQIEAQKMKLIKLCAKINSVYVKIDSNSKIEKKYVHDIFIPTNGDSKLTKTYCMDHKGSYPVYSGNTQGEYAKIDNYEYDGEYLTWAKDGLAGLMMFHNEKFSITGHRGILLPTEKCKNIDLKYIKYILEPIFRKNIKGRQGDLGKNEYTTLNSDMIRKIKDEISIPVKEDGTFDLDAQKEIALKYEQVDMIKRNLKEKIERLLSVSVE